jgi:hypothetical protein
MTRKTARQKPTPIADAVPQQSLRFLMTEKVTK